MEWISVKDRLPENDTRCLAYSNGHANVYVYSHDDYFYIVQNNTGTRHSIKLINKCITHWMPLPEPPEIGK